MYNPDFYELNDSDMATAELDNEFGVIILDKKLFSLKRRKRFSLKLIVNNGELKKIKICAPYDFIVKLFKMFNYKPSIRDDRSFSNKYGLFYRYIFIDEWYNPHYPDDESNKFKSIFDDSNDLPF